MSVTSVTNFTTIINLLLDWLQPQVDAKGFQWLKTQQQKIAADASTRVLFSSFSAVPRHVSKHSLQLDQAQTAAAQTLRPGWLPEFWTVDQTARSLLILSFPAQDGQKYFNTLEQLFVTADVGELVALYQTLPLLPYPEQYRLRGAEGIRSNMTVVFNAVALRNPYPSEYFDDLAWNQMVLKSLFVGSPLHLIQGLESRANPKLSQMLIDYAHERWAASREISPELWRAMGKFCPPESVEDLERSLAHSDWNQRAAAALACANCELPEAMALLNRNRDLRAAIESGGLTWHSLIEA